MQRNAFLGQALEQRRFRWAGDVRFPLLPIERAQDSEQIALGAADSPDAMNV